MRSRPTAAVAVVFMVAAAVGGCTSSPSALRSTTPALRTGTGSVSEKNALLTTADLRGLSGAPPDITVASPTQPSTVYQDPDEVGPCGQKLHLPPSSHEAVSEFGSSTVNGFQLIIDVSVGRATTFVTAWQHDTRPGCPPSSSRTNTGSTQTQELVSVLPLPHLVDQETGALMRITNRGQSVGAYGFIFRSGGRVEIDVLLTAQPVSAAFGNGFALKAETVLNASMGIASSGA